MALRATKSASPAALTTLSLVCYLTSPQKIFTTLTAVCCAGCPITPCPQDCVAAEEGTAKFKVVARVSCQCVKWRGQATGGGGAGEVVEQGGTPSVSVDVTGRTRLHALCSNGMQPHAPCRPHKDQPAAACVSGRSHPVHATTASNSAATQPTDHALHEREALHRSPLAIASTLLRPPLFSPTATVAQVHASSTPQPHFTLMPYTTCP